MIRGFQSFIDNIKMRNKLIITFLLIIVVLFISFMVIILRYSREVENQAMLSSLQVYGQTKAFIEYKVDLILNTLNQIVLSNDVREVLSQSSAVYSNDLALWDEDNTRLEKTTFNLESQQVFSNVIFYMKDSLAGVNESGKNKLLKNYEKSSWLQRMRSGQTQYLWLLTRVFSDSPSDDSVSILRKIPSLNNFNEIISIVRMDIPVSIFSEVLLKAVNSANELAAIVTRENEIVFSSEAGGNDNVMSILRILEENKSNPTHGKYPLLEYKEKSWVVFCQPVAKTDWRLLLAVPYDNILSANKQFRNRMILIFFAASLLTIPLIYLIVVSNTKRIKKLISTMNKVARDDFDVVILPYSSDEIGELTKNFNYMLTKISILMDEKYRLGEENKNLELIALQAQINPHFLYNTLDMLNLMSLENGDMEVNSAIHELSSFYKISLSKGQSIVTLQNEIAHVKAYVNIENMRFNNCIGLKIEIPQAYMNIRIPKLILQPIVENAIIHGIFEKDEPKGEIVLGIEISEGDLIITVEDDGVGMTAEKLESMLSGSSSNDLHGYGIQNINARIKLNFGGKYGLTFRSEPGAGTAVMIRIPL